MIMEAPNDFKIVIKKYLDQRAANDEMFAVTYVKPGKSIDECCRYILGEANKRGNAVFMSDEEVYGLAVHYFDEDNIKVSGSGKCCISGGPQSVPAKPLSQQSAVSPLKRGRVKREESELQLSLFD